jgi:hypothetical protein
VQGFNDRASSVIVRGGWWEACEDARFGGQCVTLRPGSYANLAAMGLNDRISSVRPVDRPRYGRVGLVQRAGRRATRRTTYDYRAVTTSACMKRR